MDFRTNPLTKAHLSMYYHYMLTLSDCIASVNAATVSIAIAITFGTIFCTNK